MSSNSLGQVLLSDARNSLSSFIAQKSSVNLDTPLYLYALEDSFEMSCFIYLDSNKKRFDQSGAGSIPNGIPISCLKTMLIILNKQFFWGRDIALARVCLVKFILPIPLEVQ